MAAFDYSGVVPEVREDLSEAYGKVWSMLAQPGKYSPSEVAAVGARMAAAWRDADVPLVSSCAHFDEPSRAQP